MQQVDTTKKSRPPKSNHANQRKMTKEERKCKGTLVVVLCFKAHLQKIPDEEGLPHWKMETNELLSPHFYSNH